MTDYRNHHLKNSGCIFKKLHREYANKKIDGKPAFKKISGKFIEPCIKIKPEILQLRVSIFHF